MCSDLSWKYIVWQCLQNININTVYLLFMLILIYSVYPLSCLVCCHRACGNTEASPEGPKFILILISVRGFRARWQSLS